MYLMEMNNTVELKKARMQEGKKIALKRILVISALIGCGIYNIN
jgi:hypothetical protein